MGKGKAVKTVKVSAPDCSAMVLAARMLVNGDSPEAIIKEINEAFPKHETPFNKELLDIVKSMLKEGAFSNAELVNMNVPILTSTKKAVKVVKQVVKKAVKKVSGLADAIIPEKDFADRSDGDTNTVPA